MGEVWRLIRDQGGPQENMALDAALAWAVGAGLAPPTLRLYRWVPPAVSLGYAQRGGAAVDVAACAREGLAVVRRPTGGRAVLHGDDLTYALALPRRGPWGELSVAASCRAIHEAVAAGLRRLGVPAEVGGPGGARRGEGGPLCFAVLSAHEVMVGGRKLVGSAQRRSQDAILQHGSIPLVVDRGRLARLVPGGAREADRGLGRAMTSLAEALGAPPPPAELADALAAGFAEAFGVSWGEPGYLAAERARARALSAAAYLDTPWGVW